MTLTLLLRNLLEKEYQSVLQNDPNSERLSALDRIIDEGISKHIETQLPEYINIDKPKFVAFLKAYYEWLERKENAYAKTHTLYDISDIDTTIDDFIDEFSNQFLANIPTTLAYNAASGKSVDKRKLVKNIVDFYQSKGSENSYRFLFRILYDAILDFYYPKEDILKPSDGIWISPKSIKVTRKNNTESQLRTLQNNKIYQYDWDGKLLASAIVDQVLIYDDGKYEVCELFLTDIVGVFLPNFNITSNVNGREIIERVWYQAVRIEIENGGSGYSIGDTVNIQDPYGDGTDAIGRIDDVDQRGSIINMSIIDSGVNFQKASDEIDTTENASLNIRERQAINTVKTPVTQITNDSYVTSFQSNTSETLQAQTTFVIVVESGALVEYPSYFSTNRGKLSSNKFIQDSYYYQDFSYVLKSEVNESRWKSILKKLIHPAGHEVFGYISVVRSDMDGLSYPYFHSEMNKYEIPLIGRYTPYTFSTSENLVDNSQSQNLYPVGFNPFSDGGNTASDFTITGLSGGRLEIVGSGYTLGSFNRGDTISTTPSGATGFVANWNLVDSTIAGASATRGVLFLYGVTGAFAEGMTVSNGSVSGYLGTADTSVPVFRGNGTVFIESGLTAHESLGLPLGTAGTEGFTSAQDLNLDYFNIFNHPNARGWDSIPSGISFGGITLDHFFHMIIGPMFHSNPNATSWFDGPTSEYYYPDGVSSGTINTLAGTP